MWAAKCEMTDIERRLPTRGREPLGSVSGSSGVVTTGGSLKRRVLLAEPRDERGHLPEDRVAGPSKPGFRPQSRLFRPDGG